MEMSPVISITNTRCKDCWATEIDLCPTSLELSGNPFGSDQ